MLITELDGGFLVCGDSTSDDARLLVLEQCGLVPLIVADPPYGNVVDDQWDKVESAQAHADWMKQWSADWSQCMLQGGAAYVWGGIGRPCDRAFFKYLSTVEDVTPLRMAMLITWSKRRAYGVRNNYLFTREECAYFVNGDPKKPHKFEVPYLEELRGYAGYDPEHPALDPRYRRTAVWTDVTEIMRGKLHKCHKPSKLFEIMIETHTETSDWVIDLFSGSGECALTARKLGRKFVAFESDRAAFDKIVERFANSP